jgi:hypothetical protein
MAGFSLGASVPIWFLISKVSSIAFSLEKLSGLGSHAMATIKVQSAISIR